MQTIKHIRIEDLEIHPSLDKVPTLPALLGTLQDAAFHHNDARRLEAGEETAAAWQAFLNDIRENGIIEPLKVEEEGECCLVVDGRHRLRAAIEAGLEEVPCVVVDSADVPGIIAGTVIGRRHFTKGARAWFAVLLHPDVAKIRVGNPNLKAQNPNSHSVGIGSPTGKGSAAAVTQTDLATLFGVSETLIGQACEIYRLTEKSPKTREAIEPGIWAGFGLGAVLAGLGMVKAAETDPEKLTRESDWSTAVKAGAGLARRLVGLGDWPDADRQLFADHLGAELAKLDEAAKETLRKALEVAAELAVEPERKKKPAALVPPGLATCPLCHQKNFTDRGLRAHRCPQNDGKPLSKGQWLAALTAKEPAEAIA